MIEFRLVQQDRDRDLALVQNLAEEIWQEHYTPIIGQKQVRYMLDRFQSAPAIASQIQEGYVYYLLLSEGRAAGYLAYVQQPGSPGLQLSKIYVHQDYRSQGLGRAALQQLERDCLELGLDLIWLTVNKNNSRSIAWYKKMGFEYACSLVADIGGGFVMDDYKLEKRL
ncbi:MAG: GNAT family N-acetyltransferase [Desulfohalobiaceae bacterium]